MKNCKVILIMIMTMPYLMLAGCTTSKDDITGANSNQNYKYSDYEFDKMEAQYYMKQNAAASEDGYYYIGKAPVSAENLYYLYFFDMRNEKSYQLCSKLDCSHTDENCEAYLSDDKCLGHMVWFYNDRLYMLERDAEKDKIVSYDRNCRDKKDENVISVDGMSVNVSGSTSKACLNQGYVYYFVTNESSQFLYRANINKNTTPELLKEYTSDSKIRETMSLYAIDNYVYVNITSGITESTNNYTVDCYDVINNTISEKVDANKDLNTLQNCISDWNTEISFDHNGYMYFVSIVEGDFMLNKLNLQTKECNKLYEIKSQLQTTSLKTNQNPDSDYISFEGFDGKYLYVYKGVNISLRTKDNDKSNYMYVIGIDGNIIDTIILETDESFAEEHNIRSSDNVGLSFYGGDARYILISTGKLEVSGMEISESLLKRYNEILSSDNKTPNVCIAGAFDKMQINTDNKQWINVTSD